MISGGKLFENASHWNAYWIFLVCNQNIDTFHLLIQGIRKNIIWSMANQFAYSFNPIVKEIT